MSELRELQVVPRIEDRVGSTSSGRKLKMMRQHCRQVVRARPKSAHGVMREKDVTTSREEEGIHGGNGSSR